MKVKIKMSSAAILFGTLRVTDYNNNKYNFINSYPNCQCLNQYLLQISGKYYNYDCSTSGYHDSIMADQLAGNWYLKAAGISDDENPVSFLNC